MRFVYTYRDSGNVRHDGIVVAVDRDAAYRVLKDQGIHPSRVAEAPGVFNKLFGKGKRWIAIALLSLFAIVGWVLVVCRDNAESLIRTDRHQIYGDPDILSRLDAENFATVFPDAGSRILARYSQPGRKVQSIPENEFFSAGESLVSSLTVTAPIREDDPREVVELKCIVAGMKEELREYLSDGVGTGVLYLRRLAERQEKEVELFERARNSLIGVKDVATWERTNASLRAMGLRTIPVPAEFLSESY